MAYLQGFAKDRKKRHTIDIFTGLEKEKIRLHFKNDCTIYQKTDNDDLFSYSLDSLKNYGYKIEELSYDLHSEKLDNIKTEYEEKFSNQGIKIKYLKASKKNLHK